MSTTKEPSDFKGLNRILRAYGGRSPSDPKNIGRTDKAADAITDAQYCLILVLNAYPNDEIYHACVRWYLKRHTPRDKAKLYSYIKNAMQIPPHYKLGWRTLADIVLDRLRHPQRATHGTRALIAEYGLEISQKGFDKTYRQPMLDVEGDLQGHLWLANDVAQKYWSIVFSKTA